MQVGTRGFQIIASLLTCMWRNCVGNLESDNTQVNNWDTADVAKQIRFFRHIFHFSQKSKKLHFSLPFFMIAHRTHKYEMAKRTRKKDENFPFFRDNILPNLQRHKFHPRNWLMKWISARKNCLQNFRQFTNTFYKILLPSICLWRHRLGLIVYRRNSCTQRRRNDCCSEASEVFFVVSVIDILVFERSKYEAAVITESRDIAMLRCCPFLYILLCAACFSG